MIWRNWRRALHRIAVVVVQGADIVYDGLEGLLAQRALGFDLLQKEIALKDCFVVG